MGKRGGEAVMWLGRKRVDTGMLEIEEQLETGSQGGVLTRFCGTCWNKDISGLS